MIFKIFESLFAIGIKFTGIKTKELSYNYAPLIYYERSKL